jgi:hypothetical protein
MRNKKSVLMTLNHNFGCFSGVGSGIAGNVWVLAKLPNRKAKLKNKSLNYGRKFN